MKKAEPQTNASTAWMIPGASCWVDLGESNEKYEEIFVEAKIDSVDHTSKKVKVKYSNPNLIESLPKELLADKILEVNSDYKEGGFEDMVNMEHLNEAELLHNIKLRYTNGLIFTYIGPTLLVMNPYKELDGLFTNEVISRYYKQVQNYQLFSLKDNPPHVYAISACSFRQMLSNQRNQAIVISGESGAGKTENAKYAMKFLTSLSHHDDNPAAKNDIPIEDKILSCNPILEAFGNSKTVRNDNSSRFGKYVRILVEKSTKKIQGATITNYLLEKSRITTVAEGERNYHIFYHLLKGASLDRLKSIGLTGADNKKLPFDYFEYLNKSKCFDVDKINDEKLYEEVIDSFKKMNFSKQEEDMVHRLLASILLIGNLSFDDSKLNDKNPCNIKDPVLFNKISDLLQVNSESLTKSLVFKTREIGKQLIESPQPLNECDSARDSLSKALYDKLFNWLVKRLNLTIIPKEDLEVVGRRIRKSIKEVRKSVYKQETKRLSIGLLDIFGFENFQVNSFEQLCINFTNEKLQQLYIHYIFKSEEREFVEEGLKEHLGQLAYKDNQPIIDVIDKYPTGIFDLIDESCSLGSGTDDALLQKIVKTHKDNPNMKIPKVVKNTFTVVHTAKTVEYTITNFRGKNKDEVSKDTTATITNSKIELIIQVFQGICGPEAQNLDAGVSKSSSTTQKGDKFLGPKFRLQMKELMLELQSCDCHFIRCIKPNELKKRDLFLTSYVLLQIRYLGLLETIKIRKEGFPVRREYGQFFTLYRDLNPKMFQAYMQDKSSDPRKFSQEVIKSALPNLDTNKILYGKTKIYLRTDAANRMDSLLLEIWKKKNEKAKKIYKQYCAYRFKKQMKVGLKCMHLLFRAIIKLQAKRKAKKQREKFLKKKNSVKIIQTYLKKKLMRFYLKKYRTKAILATKALKKRQAILKLLPIVRKYMMRKRIDQFHKNCALKKAYDLKMQAASEEERKRKDEELKKRRAQEEEEAKARKKKEEDQALEKKKIDEEKKELARKKQLEDMAAAELQIKQNQERKEKMEQSESMSSLPKRKEVTFAEEEKIVEEAPVPKSDPKALNKITTKDFEKFEKIDYKQLDAHVLLKTLSTFVPHHDWKEKSVIEEYTVYGSPKEPEVITYNNIPLSKDSSFDYADLDQKFLDYVKQSKFFDIVDKFIVKRKSWGKLIPVIKLLTYHKGGAPKPLQELTKRNQEKTQLIWKYITQYTGDRKMKFSPLVQVQKLLNVLSGSDVEVVDETYLLIVKQLSGCPKEETLLKLLRLTGIISSTVSPTPRIFFAVLNYLYSMSNMNSEAEENYSKEVVSTAKYAFLRITKTFEGKPRKTIPLENEILFIEARRQLMVPIYFFTSNHIYIAVESYSTVKDAKEFALKKLEMEYRMPYMALYECEKRDDVISERYLSDEEKIMDVITKWEHEKIKAFKERVHVEFKLYLRIRVYYKLIEKDLDSVCMFYLQISYDVLRGKIPITEEEALYLASQCMAVDHGDFSEEKVRFLKINIERYIPFNMIELNPPQIWIDKILINYLKLRSYSKTQAKMTYLNFLKNKELFMTDQFNVSYSKLNNVGTEQVKGPKHPAVIAIKPLILYICMKDNLKIEGTYEFSKISKWSVTADGVFVLVTRDGMTHLFESENSHNIEYLIEAYIKIAIGKDLES